MNTFNAITPADLQRGALCLVLHPHSTLNGRLLGLTAELAAASIPAAGQDPENEEQCSGTLWVLDGGNCFNVYPVARALRRYTRNVSAVLAKIRVGRAFTCFEMASLVRRSACHPGPAPAAVLALDFLSTFRDENVPLSERQRLLHTCLRPLRSLAQAAPLLVTARPATDESQAGLIPILKRAADHLLELETPLPEAGQLALRLG
jgi:hypothetical protein